MGSSCQSAALGPKSEWAARSPRRSIQDEGISEAQRYKWIESEKAGRDLGEVAIRLWVKDHWHGFLRRRWVEHLEGSVFWLELDHDDFGLLQRTFHDSHLFGPIFEMLKRGKENLDVIDWALREGHPMADVRAILAALDVNSARIECALEQRLSQFA
ncbi:MAG: hypothetical protein U0800_01705 [Isosphaeraceae bacterium]